jgi:tetratricopeptide (TPR) repeat protein
MRAWRFAAAAAVIALASPEPLRYAGERGLRRATDALRAASSVPAATGARSSALAAAEAEALRAAGLLPRDARPWLAAGGARLLARRLPEALDAYRRALACEERPEILLGLGRAHALLDRREAALAAFVRVLWVQPGLLPDLPAAAQPLARAAVDEAERDLLAGKLAAPPGAPPSAP